jgi:hypothetical protein
MEDERKKRMKNLEPRLRFFIRKILGIVLYDIKR